MNKPTEQYINEVKDLMQLQSVKAEEYYSAKRVAKDHSKNLIKYMVKNKIKEINGIQLNVYKGFPYLKLEKDIFSNIDSSVYTED